MIGVYHTMKTAFYYVRLNEYIFKSSVKQLGRHLALPVVYSPILRAWTSTVIPLLDNMFTFTF
jgi:hypothetical protein